MENKNTLLGFVYEKLSEIKSEIFLSTNNKSQLQEILRPNLKNGKPYWEESTQEICSELTKPGQRLLVYKIIPSFNNSPGNQSETGVLIIFEITKDNIFINEIEVSINLQRQDTIEILSRGNRKIFKRTSLCIDCNSLIVGFYDVL